MNHSFLRIETKAEREYGDFDRTPRIGDSVEFHPCMDIWMRGAKTGTVTSVKNVNGVMHVYVKPCIGPDGMRIKTTIHNLRPL